MNNKMKRKVSGKVAKMSRTQIERILIDNHIRINSGDRTGKLKKMLKTQIFADNIPAEILDGYFE